VAPGFFGIKPELVVKGGSSLVAMGTSAASLMTCEPLLMRPQWGAFGEAEESPVRQFRDAVAVDAVSRASSA
jgi:urease subunit alpha